MSATIYTTSTCSWCAKTKEYLKANGVEYNEINVSEDREAAKVMIEKSGQRGVPVLDINGSIVVGFDKDKIDELLNLS
jgi:glutaredoxin-like YruB-family protein